MKGRDATAITIAGSRVKKCHGGTCRELPVEAHVGDRGTSHLHVSLRVTHGETTKWIDFTLQAGQERGKSIMKTRVGTNIGNDI